MRQAKWWVRFLVKCAVAVWLVHLATGVGLLQAMAVLCLFLWAGVLVMQALERLLRACFSATDDAGPEEHSPIIIRIEPEDGAPHPIAPPSPGYRKWWRN